MRNQRGLTVLELIIASAILVALATMAMPLAQVKLKRDQETRLRIALREIRTAIDRYKDAADRNLIKVKLDTEGYPPDLEDLVEGVELAGKPGRRVRFLRNVPIDPMTGRDDWGKRSVQGDPDSLRWDGKNVFDVYSRSRGMALDGSYYSDW